MTVGGRLFRKFKTSAMRTLLKPPFSGNGSNICPRTYWITCATSRSDRLVVKSAASPWSSRRSPKKSSSSVAGRSGLETERWTGLRRGREENGEVAERLIRGFRLLGFVMREECAAENWRGILAGRRMDASYVWILQDTSGWLVVRSRHGWCVG